MSGRHAPHPRRSIGPLKAATHKSSVKPPAAPGQRPDKRLGQGAVDIKQSSQLFQPVNYAPSASRPLLETGSRGDDRACRRPCPVPRHDSQAWQAPKKLEDPLALRAWFYRKGDSKKNSQAYDDQRS